LAGGARAVNLSLEGGNCDGSCYAYAVLGLLAGPQFGDYQAGLRLGWLGYELVERRGLKGFQARAFMNYAALVMLWTRDIRGGLDLMRRALETAIEIGDLTYATYSYTHLNTNRLAAGDPLDDIQAEAERGLAFAENMRFGFAIDCIAGHLGLIRTLRGLTPNFGCFDDGFRQSCADCKASPFFIVLLMTRPSRGGRYGLLEGSDGDERRLVRFGGSGNWRAAGSGVHHGLGKSEPPSERHRSHALAHIGS